MELGNSRPAATSGYQVDWRIMVCLLGGFRLLRAGESVTARSGAKTEALLANLALRHRYPVPRDALLDALWPDQDRMLAGQCLNSLVHGLNKLLGDVIGGASPVVHGEGSYRLNLEAGIGVDVVCFDTLADQGEEQARRGDRDAAARSFAGALDLYRGDLSVGSDVHAAMERERLRARCLTLLARLADHHFGMEDYSASLSHALRLLSADACREDAHRLAMRCYVRRGERAQALRQYRVCEAMLRAEFDASPEPATVELFEQVRKNPDSI